MEPVRVAGVDDAQERMARAAKSYEWSRQTGPPMLWPEGGVAGFEPLVDQLLGENHLVRIRLAPGARSARHTHDCDQLIIVVEGRGSLMTDDNVVDLHPGTVVFTPAGVPHVHASNELTDVEYVYLTRTGHDTQVQ